MNKLKILGLRTCIYTVQDLKKATEWYSRLFATEPYFREDFYVGFNIGGFELGLIPAEGKPHPGAGGVLTYWGVEDVEAVYRSFIDAGAEEHEAPHNVGGEIVVASVLDPWKNIVGLIFNPGFSLEAPPVH